MEFLERLCLNENSLTATEKRISEYILKNRQETVRSSIADLAAWCRASRSAVLRFTQKLGYSGYTEFRYDFSIFVHAGRVDQQERKGLNQVLASYYEATIHKLPEYVSEEQLREISTCVAGARRVKIFGMNRNSYSAMQLRHHFHSLNLDAEAVSDPVLVRDLSAAGETGDVHIYFSVSGETPIVRDAIHSSRSHGATTVLITTHKDCSMAAGASWQVILPSTQLVTTDYFFDQQAVNFIFIELLIVYLGEAMAERRALTR